MSRIVKHEFAYLIVRLIEFWKELGFMKEEVGDNCLRMINLGHVIVRLINNASMMIVLI